MRKQKFSLAERIDSLGLDPKLADLLEEGRPLTDRSLRTVNSHVDKVHKYVGMLRDKCDFMSDEIRFAALTACFGFMLDPWSRAVCSGAEHLIYSGEYTTQDAYNVLCLAAGSCLKASSAEPFRIILSIITRAGLKPCRHDRSPLSNIPVAQPGALWTSLAETYSSLEEIKGSEVLRCLALGLGVGLLEGRLSKSTAKSVFTTQSCWRGSSPLPQLLARETFSK